MEKRFFAILKIIAVVFVVILLVSQLYKAFYNPFTTETVMQANYYDGIDALGIVIREESVITADYSGVLGYACREGERVALDGIVANIFPNVEAANAKLEIEKIEEQIQTLKDIQTYNDLYAADVGVIDQKITEALVSLAGDHQEGKKNLDSVAAEELGAYLNRKQIVTGKVQNFSPLITSLETRKAGYEGLYEEALGNVKTDRSGYFISVIDGYEEILTPETISSLTAEKLSSLKPQQLPSNAVCKIVSDYHWYIAVEVSFDYSLTLGVGSNMQLKTAVGGYSDLPVSVASINRTTSDKNAVVVFECKTVSEELAGLRTLPVTIVKESYEGLKVSSEAIRVQNGKTGVYIYRNNQLKFVEVNILYNGKYSIVEQVTGKENVLRLYDEIIVRGRDLYDGKIIE